MQEQREFRERSREVSRLEAFSDIVFGFALTLIVISLEVPQTFAELKEDMRGFLGFAICFAVLVWIWHAHHQFFRRYALTDGVIMLLNTILLFVVLFYIYPLKFLFSLITGGLRAERPLLPSDVPLLFTIYGLGFAALFAVFFLMHRHALSRRVALELTPFELVITRRSMAMHGAHVAIGILSTLMALVLPLRWIGIAGWVYFLIGPMSALIWARKIPTD